MDNNEAVNEEITPVVLEDVEGVPAGLTGDTYTVENRAVPITDLSVTREIVVSDAAGAAVAVKVIVYLSQATNGPEAMLAVLDRISDLAEQAVSSQRPAGPAQGLAAIVTGIERLSPVDGDIIIVRSAQGLTMQQAQTIKEGVKGVSGARIIVLSIAGDQEPVATMLMHEADMNLLGWYRRAPAE